MSVTITPLYAGLLALFYIFLSFAVIGKRRSTKTGLGTGEEGQLLRSVRTHGNFAEYVPFLLLLLFMLEVNNLGPLYLHTLGVALLVGRILHYLGIRSSTGVSFGRFWGTSLTFLVFMISAFALIAMFVKGHL